MIEIEGAQIGDCNIFGTKCHVMEGSLIENGCLIRDRVIIIPNKKIRNNTVVCVPNIMYFQPMTKKRNRVYIEKLTAISQEKFELQKRNGVNPRIIIEGSSKGTRNSKDVRRNILKVKW